MISDVEPPDLRMGPSRTIQVGSICVNGLRLHVESAGHSGPALVLFHGYLGTTATWRRAMPYLAQGMRVFAVDLPGFGRSDRPADAPYTVGWFADLLPGVLAALNLHRPWVAGLSWGGAVVLQAAARTPELARGLVLVSPLLKGDRAPPGLRLAERFPGLGRAFFSSWLGRRLIPLLVQRAGFTGRDRRSGVRARRLLAYLDAPGGWEAATRSGLAAARGAPGEDVVCQVKVPALVVWGAADPVHAPSRGRELASRLGGSARLAILNASHNCHDEQAAGFAREVARFVAEHDAATRLPDFHPHACKPHRMGSAGVDRRHAV